MKDKFFRIISLVLTTAILLTSIPVAAVEDDDNIDRIEGENRYETSALISKEFFDKSDTVIIASGKVFPDALVGGVLAAYEKSPLLTVGKDHIPSPISAEIQRLGASKAYVLGGESTISPSVISGLSSMGVEAQRIGGADRYQTADNVAKAIVGNYQVDPSKVYYASGLNFPDALAAVPLVRANNGILLLSDGSPINEGIAIGGPDSVPGNVERIAGANRYDTALEIAKLSPSDKAILVDGTNYPDALSISVVASIIGADILLTDPQVLPVKLGEVLDTNYESALIVGGKNSVSPQIEDTIEDILEDSHGSTADQDTKEDKEDQDDKEEPGFRGEDQEDPQDPVEPEDPEDEPVQKSVDIEQTNESINISEARGQEGQTVIVTGVVTLSDNYNIVIEDNTAGINIYKNKLPLEADLGDRVEVTGKIGAYSGLVQITPESESDYEVLDKGHQLPLQEITIGEYNANPVEYESERLIFKEVIIGTGDQYNTPISQGEDSVNVYRMPKDNIRPNSLANVIAVGSVHKGNEQLKVNSRNDIKVLVQGEGPDLGGEYTKINKIQGNTLQSPIKGEQVQTKGVVIARSQDKYNQGYYIHSLKDDVDEDPNTSEAIFVPTGYKGVERGDIVEVAGTVEERKYMSSWDDQLTVTSIEKNQITDTNEDYTEDQLDAFTTQLKAENIPTELAPVNVNFDEDTHGRYKINHKGSAMEYFKSLECMPVRITNGEIVAAVERYGDITVLPERSEGVDYPRTVNGGVKYHYDHPNVAALTVSDAALPITSRNTATGFDEWIDPSFKPYPGKVFDGDIEGVMVYAFSDFKILNYEKLPDLVGEGNGPDGKTDLATDENSITMAVYNLLNFSKKDSARAGRIADQIVKKMQNPDLIGLDEVQDNNGPDKGGTAADETLQFLINKISAAGGIEYKPVNIDPPGGVDGGAPNANIRPAYLYNPEKLELVEKNVQGDRASRPEDAVEFIDGKASLKMNPIRYGDGIEAFEGSRKPLIAEFEVRQGHGAETGQRIIVINNHLKSKGPDDALNGPVQPAKRSSEVQRHAQARALADLVSYIVKNDPQANIVVMGDLNDYEFSETLNIIKGSGLTNLVDLLPEGERYSYIYQGNSQTLDHMLISKGLEDNLTGQEFLNINAEFPAADGFASDHDPMMAKFDFSDEVIDRTINPDDGENGLEQGQPSSDTSVEAIYVDGVEAVNRTSISNKLGYYVLFPRSKDLSEIQTSDLEVKTPSNANSTITDIEIEYKTVSGILANVNLKFTVVAEDQVTTEDYIVYLRYLVEDEEDSLQSGQYILADTNNQVPGVLDGTWVTREDAAEDPRTMTDSIMTLEIEGDQVKIKDSNGKYIAPKGGNNNGIKEGEYSWLLVYNEDGTYSFKGQGNDTVEFANNKSATGYRAYKQSTVNGSPNSYPSDFKLYKVD